jgi:hypothetical protein
MTRDEHYFPINRARALSYIEYHVRRNGWLPAPIARSAACKDLSMGHATWTRCVRALLDAGYLWKEARPGRYKKQKKNPGSLYQVNWKRIARDAEANWKSAHPQRKPAHLTPSLYLEIGSLGYEIASDFRVRNRLKVGGNYPYRDGDTSLAAREWRRPGETTKNGAGQAGDENRPSLSPNPSPQGEGASSAPEHPRLVNVSLSPDIFATCSEDDEALGMYLERGMVRWANPTEAPEFQAAKRLIEERVGETAEDRRNRYLEAVAAQGANA